MQWIRIGIRLGSQLLTVLVVMFIIHSGFPAISYTPISLPSNVAITAGQHIGVSTLLRQPHMVRAAVSLPVLARGK